MGDNNNITVPGRIEVPKTSIEILRETQPTEDISAKIKNTVPPPEQSPPPPTPKIKEQSSNPESLEESKVETYFKKIDLEERSDSTTETLTKRIETPTDSLDRSKRDSNISNEKSSEVERHKSEIITNNKDDSAKSSGVESKNVNKMKHLSSNVFPVGCMGCKENGVETTKSRRFISAREANLDHVGHIDNTPKKRPTSCRHGVHRNPLTGVGVEDYNNKYKGSTIKKKDGNPLLGTGYEDPVRRSETKVPPGGFSHGIW